MSEDLINQLRNSKGWPTLGNAAADRIEELEAACWRMKEDRDRAIGWRDSDKDRAEAAEAKLAKAVEALVAWRYYDENVEQDHVSLMLNYADAIEKTRATLAELKGGKDE